MADKFNALPGAAQTPAPGSSQRLVETPQGNFAPQVAVTASDGAPLVAGTDYQYVAASSTDTLLGPNGGAIGDTLIELLIIPATTSPGAVSIKDGAGGSITVFQGGAGSVPSLWPNPVILGIKSISGAWSITTGADVSVMVVGELT